MAALQGTMSLSPALRAALALAEAGRLAASAVLVTLARLGALFLGSPLLRSLYLGPLWQRSQVLRGASVSLHSVRTRPTVAGGARGSLVPQVHTLDLTVRPGARQIVLRWRPEDLSLVAPGAHPGRPEEDDVVGRILAVEVHRHGTFELFDGASLIGPQRLRIHAAFRPGARRFHFRYFLEILNRPSTQKRPTRGASA